MTAAYSDREDLLTGNVPVPTNTVADRYCSDATDEIDSVIGYIYVTPLNMSETGPISRPARLLIKRLNNFIASARFIMAVCAGTEDKDLNAYALYLLKQAQETLKLIGEGKIVLDGAPVLNTAEYETSGPMIKNLDKESNVEAFYGRISNPNYTYWWPQPVRFDGQ